MAEVKYVIKTEADLAGITKATAEVDKLNQKSNELDRTSKQLKGTQAQVAVTQDAVAASSARATTSLKTTINATELLNKAFSRLKSVLVGIAWGAIAASVAYLAKWVFNLVTGLEKAEKAMEDFKAAADEAAKSKKRMADEVKRSRDAVDEETDAIKRQEDVRERELKRAKAFAEVTGVPLTEEERAAKQFEIEKEFGRKQADIGIQSLEAQLEAASAPLGAARSAEAAARRAFAESKGQPAEERNVLLGRLQFAQGNLAAAEKQFGPTVSNLTSDIQQFRADAASSDMVLRAQRENTLLQKEQEKLLKEQAEALKASNEAVRQSIRDMNSRSKTSRD